MSAAAFFKIGGEPCARSGWRGDAMPYGSNSDLPASVQAHLPPHAQDIYSEAFNHAFAAHAGDPDQEERAHRIAWAAVKRSYVKVGDSWIGRDRT
jgi:cation transport regulator